MPKTLPNYTISTTTEKKLDVGTDKFELCSSYPPNFRSQRSDAAVLICINDSSKWFAVEYERSQKSELRYTERIKKWYQSENLFSVILVAESESLIRHLAKIDAKTYPHKPRKIFYISIDKLRSATKELALINCNNQPHYFRIDPKVRLHFPIYQQGFDNSQAKES